MPCSAWRRLDRGVPPLGRPDDDPVSVLDLLEPRRGRRPEVVLGRIEGQVTAERRVGSRLVPLIAYRLVGDAPRRLDPRHEDLPGVPGSGRLGLERGIWQLGLGGAVLEV